MSRRVIFEDSKTGKIIQVSNAVGVNEEFCLGKDCWDCSVFDKTEEGGIENCTRWVLENPHEAGKLMGYRVWPCRRMRGKRKKIIVKKIGMKFRINLRMNPKSLSCSSI